VTYLYVFFTDQVSHLLQVAILLNKILCIIGTHSENCLHQSDILVTN